MAADLKVAAARSALSSGSKQERKNAIKRRQAKYFARRRYIALILLGARPIEHVSKPIMASP